MRRPGVVTFSLALVVLVAVADRPYAAFADATVTDCVSDTQGGPGVNLAQALNGGGIVRFACPPGTTIRMTRRYTLSGPTAIIGNGIVLDGRGMFGPLLTSAQNTILRTITVRGMSTQRVIGRRLGRRPVSVLEASGTAELDGATLEANDDPIEIRGVAWIHDSAFVGNRAGYALALGSSRATIERTRFTANDTAVAMSVGTIRSSDFSGQTHGAVTIEPAAGPVEIVHSTFESTSGGTAVRLSARAAQRGTQTVSLRANTFDDNDGGSSAGAVAFYDIVDEARGFGFAPPELAIFGRFPPATFVFAYNEFERNRGARGGAIAADLAHASGLRSTGDLFVGNMAAGDGGALVVTGGTMVIAHALFANNRATGRGAAVALGTNGRASLANTLVVANRGPAAALAGAAFELTNVTVANNAAIGFAGGAGGRVRNAIFAANRPADCSSLAAGTFVGPSLQSDASCPAATTGDAFLDAFYVPATDSPALRSGDATVCRDAPVGGVDLAFQVRAPRAFCALGAFEQAPVRKFVTRSDRRPPHATAADDFSDTDGYRPPPSVPR